MAWAGPYAGRNSKDADPAIDEGVLTDNSFASTLLVTHFLLADALYMLHVAAINEVGAWWTISSIVGEEI